MFKRVALFIATNLAVLLVLSIVLRLLGVDQILDESGAGINYEALLVLSLVIGFGYGVRSARWRPQRNILYWMAETRCPALQPFYVGTALS